MVETRTGALFLLLALLAALLGVPGRALAQDPLQEEDEEEAAGPLVPRKGRIGVRVEPFADGFARSGEWALVRARVANGADSTMGALSVTEADLDGGEAVTYHRQVELPTGTVKAVELYYRPNLIGGTREITLSAGGRPRTVVYGLQVIPEQVVTVGLVGDDPMGLPVVNTAWEGPVPGRRPRPDADGDREVRHAQIPIASLPEHSAAYAALDWVVWPEADPSRISASQAEALRNWVADGGHLLVTVTDRWQIVGRSPLADMLPVVLTGLEDAPDLSPLTRALGGRAGMTMSPVATSELRDVPGRWTHALARLPDGRPVWAVGTFGLGTVHVVLANPGLEPLSKSVLREDLWRRLLWLPRPGERGTWLRDGVRAGDGGVDRMEVTLPLGLALNLYSPEQSCAYDASTSHTFGYFGNDPEQMREEALRKELQDIPGVAPLPMSWLIGFALVYLLAIGPVDYLVLRLLNRQPLTWITFPLTIALFSGAALYGTARAKGNQAVVNRIEVVDVLPGSGVWRGETWLGVFSTRKTALRLRSGYPDGLAVPLKSPGFMNAPTVRTGEGAGELSWHAETWTLAYARSSWTAARPGAVSLEREGGEWIVHSTLPMALDEAELRVGDRVFALGRLAPGERRAIDGSSASTRSELSGRFVVDSMMEYPEPGRGHLHLGQRAVVVGLLESPIEPFELAGLAPESRHTTLMRIPVASAPQLAAWGALDASSFSTAFDGGLR